LLLETIHKITNAKVDVQLRAQLLDVLVRLFTSNKHADFVAICQCLVKLNRPEDIGKLLDRLMIRENGDLIAYQIAFDLYENASQQFNTQVLNTYANQHQSRYFMELRNRKKALQQRLKWLVWIPSISIVLLRYHDEDRSCAG
ncbi:hypothetical protein NECAME_17182, partial [Necator americanus]